MVFNGTKFCDGRSCVRSTYQQIWEGVMMLATPENKMKHLEAILPIMHTENIIEVHGTCVSKTLTLVCFYTNYKDILVYYGQTQMVSGISDCSLDHEPMV